MCLHLHADAHPGSRPGPGAGPLGDSERWKFDCSHMCVPGPLDIVPQFLYHVLVGMDEVGGEGGRERKRERKRE